LVDIQLDAQNPYLFTYNTFIKINKNFVHQFGDQPRLYYDARSAKPQDLKHGLKVIFLVF